jgi:hypothetical protein
MIEQRIHAQDDPKWTKWLNEILEDYNSNPHETLNNQTPDEVYADPVALHQRWVADTLYNRTVSKDVVEAFKPGDYVRLKLQKPIFEKGATQTMSLEVYQVEAVKGTRVSLKTYPDGKAVARAAKPNELMRVDKPQNLPAPKAIQTAKKQARQARRLVREGLAEPEPDKEAAGDTVADVAQKDKLLVIDVEGQAKEGEDPHVLVVQKGQQKGYVFAGVVTKVSKKKVYLRMLAPVGGGSNSLSQKRLTLSERSLSVDGTAHKDAVLYLGDAPRLRTGGVTSLPKSVIDIITKEYVFT